MENLDGRACIEHSPAQLVAERVLAIQVLNDVAWVLYTLQKCHLLPGYIWATFMLNSGQHTSQPQFHRPTKDWCVIWRKGGFMDTRHSLGDASICSVEALKSGDWMWK